MPYEKIGDFGKVGVMVGHLDVPNLTGAQPASLAAPAYQLLRQDYAFDGPIITDDLGAMRAISDRHGLPDAVLLALRSGADQASGRPAAGSMKYSIGWRMPFRPAN